MNADEEGFWISIITVLLLIIGSMLVNDESVPVAEIEKAIKVCEANGGLDFIEVDLTGHETVCNNGLRYFIHEDEYEDKTYNI